MTQPIPLTDSDLVDSDLVIAPESRSKPISNRGVRFLCRLGQGGMAEVHLANAAPAHALPHLVVVKRMHQQHQDDPATVRMFLDEARLALCLVHPNIVRSERLGMFEGRHGIVMEFLDGQPFHLLLKRAYESEASISIDAVVQIAIAALDGLHYAHEFKDVVGNPLNLVHRDVSPQNLFVTYAGAVKLLDFGIAKNSMQDGRTRTGLLKGKISYMAPEQARGDELDRRADIWSLGVLLWEAVTGHRLFKGSNEAATLNLTLTEEISPPSQRRPDLPFELEAILMRALERDRERRYPTAAAMRDDLEAWLGTRDLLPGAALSELMQRLFAREIRDQRQQIQGLLNAVPEPAPEHSTTMMAPLLGTSATLSGSLRGTQVSSVTDLMDELTRQRRVTTRLLSGLVLLVAVALMFGVYWTLVLRPAQTSEQAAANALATKQAAVVAAADLATAQNAPQPAAPAAAEEPRAEANDKPSSSSARHAGKVARVPPLAAPVVATAVAISPASPALAPAPPAATAEVGYLNLDTTPWSTVSVGGRVLGQTPIVGASLPAGTHTLVLSNPEQGVRTTYQVTISAGKTTARRIGLD